MKISIVGIGYVGLVTGTCFAEAGHHVICIDIDKKKIENLQKGIIPIYEPGLTELIDRNTKENRLIFSDNIKEGVIHGDIIFSAVGTPPDKNWRADLSAVKEVAKNFGKYADKYKIFVNKSTVPIGTSLVCEEIIKKQFKKRKLGIAFDVVSNPEFLREGAAIKDTMNPSRIIIGSKSPKAIKIMKKIFEPFVRAQSPIIIMSNKSAEITKYASNSFLGTKISFINEMANFCEKAGGDIKEITYGMGMDSRIGNRFLHAGIGYGGSCFPKDMQAMIQIGKDYDYDFRIIRAAEAVNNCQKKKLFKRLEEMFPKLENKIIAVLGLAFKPRTDDMRDAPSIKVIKKLQAEGAIIRAYDPVAMKNAKKYFSQINLTYAKNVMEAATNADALVLLTEWDEFRGIDFLELKNVMRGNIIIDGRNIFNAQELLTYGFNYSGVGKKLKNNQTDLEDNYK